MRRHLIIYIYVFLLACTTASAQTDAPRQIYNHAERDYKIGRTEQAFTLLQEHIDSFEGDLRQSVLRLMALCCLSEDRDEEARLYAGQLIKLNNYYNAIDDPARFQDLIKQLKGGVTTMITTASSQSESISEAPSPVTIITAEMIEELGYNKNLNQILAAYVPGMAEITSLDEITNLSMHSAYALGQELILIMENGHRLNSRYDNTGTTTYSISTEKIDHIEVLRGPASSLYGNVALSAVVNIITKSGRDLNGVKMKYGYANFGTHKADLTIGTQFMNADIYAWASIYKSDGQIRHYSDGEGYYKEIYKNNGEEWGYYKSIEVAPDIIHIEGFRDTPAYDIGLTFKLKGFDLMFSKKSYKKMQIVTDHGGYNYDRFYPVNDIKPGNGTDETHAELTYTHQFKDIQLSGSAYADWYTFHRYMVSHDSVAYYEPLYDYETNELVYDENGNIVYEITTVAGQAAYSRIRERALGGMLKASSPYRIGKMKGNLLAGVQYEHFSILSRNNMWIQNFKQVDAGDLDLSTIAKAGKEKSLSFFVQDKHYFTPKLILNAGLRYDMKYRQEDEVKSFSPRFAMVYVPNDQFSLKLSYSEAYTDLSFYYRFVADQGYTIEPQHLSAIQLTASGTIKDLHLNYEANLFYNKYKHLLCWSPRDLDMDEYNTGINNGKLSTIGIEGSASYSHKRLSAGLSFYLCKDTDMSHFYYNATENVVTGVPHLTLNLHGALKLIECKYHELKVYGHASYTGRKLNFQPYDETSDYWVDAKTRFDLGVKYCYNQRMQVSLDCENLFDTYNYICGPTYQSVPVFQRGRTLMASISYQF